MGAKIAQSYVEKGATNREAMLNFRSSFSSNLFLIVALITAASVACGASSFKLASGAFSPERSAGFKRFPHHLNDSSLMGFT